MTPTIPIPTDHIYKFYALCGLAFFVAALLGSVYLNSRFNETGGEIYLELEGLNRKTNLSQEEELKKNLLSEKYRVHQADKKLFLQGLGAVAGVGIVGMVMGFVPWHTKVQPKQDKLVELQIKKLEREILKLDQELATASAGPADAEALNGAQSAPEP